MSKEGRELRANKPNMRHGGVGILGDGAKQREWSVKSNQAIMNIFHEACQVYSKVRQRCYCTFPFSIPLHT